MTAIIAVLLTTASAQAQDDAAARVAELIKQLTDEPTAHQAFESLSELGPAAVPQLVHSHRHGDAGQRVGTYMLLTRMGPEAVPPLVTALRDGGAEAIESQSGLATGLRDGCVEWVHTQPQNGRPGAAKGGPK